MEEIERDRRVAHLLGVPLADDDDFARRHRECGPDCCITGDRCEDAEGGGGTGGAPRLALPAMVPMFGEVPF